EGLKCIARAQKSIRELDSKVGNEVRTLFPKERMLLHMNAKIEVSRLAARNSLTCFCKPDHLATLDAAWNFHFDVLVALCDACAAAYRTFFFWLLACAVTCLTCPCRLERTDDRSPDFG